MANSPSPGVPQTATKANYGSLVVAITTIVLYALARLTGIVELPAATLVQDAVVAVVGAAINAGLTWFTVYQTRNSRTLALLLCAAVAGSLLLGGCATPRPGDTSGIQKNIAYAEGYVAVAKAAAATCIALRLPVCSSPAFVAGVAKATAVADEAIAEAKSYPVDGSTADKINAALRVAMNAVLLFTSLR